jgi:CheY-like chemotaxis protein
MARKRAICFVDDQPDEIARFRQYLGERFIIGAGTSLDSAIADLRANGIKRPDVILLDMYMRTGPPLHNEADAHAALNTARARFLHSEAEFYLALEGLGQRSDPGFENLRDARHRYSLPMPILGRINTVPVAFFTRKGTLDNAVRAFAEDVDAILKKPDPPIQTAINAAETRLPELYDQAFERDANNLADLIERVIRRRGWWGRTRGIVIAAAVSVSLGFVAGVLSKLAISWMFGNV